MSLPLVLLHGFTGRADSFAEVVARLDLKRKVLALDLPGHAPDQPIDRKWSFEDAVDHLAARIHHHFHEQVHVAGYSLGARLALGLAVRHPTLIARATLIGLHPGLGDDRTQRLTDDARLSALLRRHGLEAFLSHWEALPLFETQKALSPRVIEQQRRIRRSHDAHALADCLDTMGLAKMPDYRRSELTMSVEVIVGEYDSKFRELAEEMARAQPALRMIIAEGCGHNVVLERPDLVARSLA